MYLDCISAHMLKYNTIHARYMYLDCHTWTDTKDGKHFARIIETKMGYVIQQGEVASGPGGVEEDVESSDSERSEDDDAQARPQSCRCPRRHRPRGRPRSRPRRLLPRQRLPQARLPSASAVLPRVIE